MKGEVLRVFFTVAVCLSVIPDFASGGRNGLGRADKESCHTCNCSCDSCCSSDNSTVNQSHQLFTNGFEQFSVGDKVFRNSGDITMSADVIQNITCGTVWFIPKQFTNGSISCECGSSLEGIVECDSYSGKVSLFRCYCMTFNIDGSMAIVAPCLYGCTAERDNNPYNPLPSNISKLNELCSRYHREGQLCGRCVDGFALPVYSYNLSCVDCKNDDASNWVKYLVASLLPLTLFLIMIVTFRVRVTSGLMNAFILLSQLISLPAISRIFMLELRYHYQSNFTYFVFGAVFISFFSIWNLDFFRILYPSFCLHPKITTLQIIALDYVIAVYPLLLLVVIYLLVKLHDSGVKPIVWLWRPFMKCFIHFRRDWNIKTSLIDAFATFLLLSYMKFLSVSFDLLVPVRTFNIHAKKSSKLYLYWDGTIEYFGSEHLPYAILALVVFVLFNFLPLLLMCLYPCQRFQKCLNYCRLQSHILHTFMDAFQGCYKDGTNGSCDCRWFEGLYLFTRILVMIILGVTKSRFSIALNGYIVLILLLLTALLQPYKVHSHNRINIFFLLIINFITLSCMSTMMVFSQTIQHVLNAIFGISLSIPLLYFVSIILYNIFGHRRFVQKYYLKMCKVCIKRNVDNYEGALPDRMVNVEECAALLADPMQVSFSDEEINVSTN